MSLGRANLAQASEIAKYFEAYKNEAYKMSPARREAVEKALARIPTEFRGSLLDVGTGRGETLDVARRLGFSCVMGTEVVPELLGESFVDAARARESGVLRSVNDPVAGIVEALAWSLPFVSQSFETVTCFDVMEHLLPEDAEPTIRELARVAHRRVVLTISNLPSSMLPGVELHVNRRPYYEWDESLKAWLPGWKVEWLPDSRSLISEMWEATR